MVCGLSPVEKLKRGTISAEKYEMKQLEKFLQIPEEEEGGKIPFLLS